MSAKLDALLMSISTAIAEYLGVSAEEAETPAKKAVGKKPTLIKKPPAPSIDMTDLRAAYLQVAAESPKAAKALKALMTELDAERIDDLDEEGAYAVAAHLCEALGVDELPRAPEDFTETPKASKASNAKKPAAPKKTAKPAADEEEEEDAPAAQSGEPEGMADLRDAYDLYFARDRRAARSMLKDNDLADIEDAASLDDEGIETLTKMLKDAARKASRK